MLRKIIVRLAPLFWIIDILILRLDNKKKSDNTDTIVFVRLDAIGDFVMWLDAARQYRKVYGDKKLVLICNKAYKDIAESTRLFDEIIALDNKEFLFPGNIGYRLKIRKELKKLSASMVIQAVFSRRIYADYVVSAISAPAKITMKDTGFDNTSSWALSLSDKIYTQIVDIDEKYLSELQKNAEFVRQITKIPFKSSVPVLEKMQIDESLIPKCEYFVVFPGGSFSGKMWPPERFAKVSEAIYKKNGWIPVILGAPNETYLAKKFIEEYKGSTVIDYTGKTNLIESIEIIRNAKYLIGNDTSGIHFAAATNVPSLCVFGGWHFGRFLPYEVDDAKGRSLPNIYCHDMICYGCKIIHKTSKCAKRLEQTKRFICIDDITPEEVIKEILEKI